MTSLALSVFLTLSKTNFERYIKIAPELKDVILRRQESSGGGVSGGNMEEDVRAANGQAAQQVPQRMGGKRSSGPLLAGTAAYITRVAGNVSHTTSPIFEIPAAATTDFTSSHPLGARHPELHRLATAASNASTPLITSNTLAARQALLSPMNAGQSGFQFPVAASAASEKTDRPGLMLRTPSLDRPVLGSTSGGASSGVVGSSPPASPVGRKPALAPLAKDSSSSGSPSQPPVMGRAQSTLTIGSGISAADDSGKALGKQRPSVLSKELQAYELQNVK